MIFIRYYENIIIDESVDIELTQIKNLIAQGIAVYNLYAICVSNKGNGIMEILSCTDLLKEINLSMNYGIIAMAKGRKNTDRMLCSLIESWINENRDLSLFRNYYNNRCY